MDSLVHFNLFLPFVTQSGGVGTQLLKGSKYCNDFVGAKLFHAHEMTLLTQNPVPSYCCDVHLGVP